MKFWLLGFLLTMCLQVTALAAPAYIDIVFDIDWTTFYSINPQDQNQADRRMLIIEGKAYRPTEHLGEVLERLSRHPEVRISFFSGGERSRNEALLKAFKLPSGRSAFDISYKVLSKENLRVLSEDTRLGFSERYKKAINGTLPGANIGRTILIDDQVNFAVDSWKAVDSLGRLTFQKAFDPTKASHLHYPKNRDEWLKEKDKALMWSALLEDALAKAKISDKPFSEIVSDLWAEKSHRALCKNIF